MKGIVLRKKHTHLARNLRTNSTVAEKLLWGKLRANQLEGCKFRRQQPIGPYIVDFVNLEKRIVIEIDGGQHAVEKEKDRERDNTLRGQGFEILRFWDNEVLGNLDGVLEVIRSKLITPLPLVPSHKGRGLGGI